MTLYTNFAKTKESQFIDGSAVGISLTEIGKRLSVF